MPIRIFNTFDDPLASTGSTLAFGVNDTDQIVGYYQNGSGNHGFLLSGGIYTTLDDPSATLGTIAQGINSLGQIVGFYDNASGNHGFLLSGGTYTTLNDPSATHGTVAFGVNAAGQIVGHYTDCMSSEHFGQLAWQFKRVSGSSGLKVQAAIAC